MNAASQPALEFPSEPISGDTRATVELVGEDWMASRDWTEFQEACRYVAEPVVLNGQWFHFVDPNQVRAYLSFGGALSIEPRRYSAFWHRAARGKDAFLVADGWVTNTDHAGGNAGKPLRRYRLRAP